MPRIKSLSAIRAQIRALEKRAKTIETKADKKITQLIGLIQRHGLSLSDWRRALALSKTGKRSGPRKGKRVPVKYADDKGNKWTGRGRPPLWLVAAEKAGKKRDSFLVKAAKGKQDAGCADIALNAHTPALMREVPEGYASSDRIDDVEGERMDRDIDLFVQAFRAKCREVIRPEIDSAIKADLEDWLARLAVSAP